MMLPLLRRLIGLSPEDRAAERAQDAAAMAKERDRTARLVSRLRCEPEDPHCRVVISWEDLAGTLPNGRREGTR